MTGAVVFMKLWELFKRGHQSDALAKDVVHGIIRTFEYNIPM